MHHARHLLIILFFAIIAAVPLAGPSAAQGVPGGSLVCIRREAPQHPHAVADHELLQPEADAEPSDIMIVFELINSAVY